MEQATALFRVLGDDARLRLLRLVAAERLNVSELTAILGIAQSGVSRHLGLLKDAGLVVESREGGFTYYRLAPGATSTADGDRALWALLRSQFALAAATPVGREDDARLEEVRRLRKENFDAHAASDGRERQLVPGRSWAAWARALGHLLPPLRVADLGCGEGYLTVEASRWAAGVIAVDRSPTVLSRARALASRRRVGNIVWRRGDLEELPIRDDAVDVALLSQALHHAGDPGAALVEAARIVVPGGRVLILDLREHGQEWVRERLGDRWLGFTEPELVALMKKAGLVDIKVQIGTRRRGDPFVVLIASGVKPASQGRRPSRKSSVRRGARH